MTTGRIELLRDSTDRGRLDPEQHDEIYARIRAELFTGFIPAKESRVIFLAAQPGSGKSRLSRKIGNATEFEDPFIINTDLLRHFHPDYEKLCRERPFDMPHLMGSDVNKWAGQLLDDAMQKGLGIVSETTLRDVPAMVSTVEKIQKNGYKVSLYCMAVNAEESVLGIFHRFESTLKKTGVGFWTHLDFHNGVYDAIPGNLDVLERSGLFDTIVVCQRDGKILYRNDGTPPLLAKEALVNEREKPWQDLKIRSHLSSWVEIMRSITSRNGPMPDNYRQEAQHRLAEARIKAELSRA